MKPTTRTENGAAGVERIREVAEQRKGAQPAEYHRMSVAQKHVEALAAVREASTWCPDCDTQVMPADLLAHRERCEGPRAPGPGSRWITWREARALVPERTLLRWIDRGRVRVRGERGDRQYLLRDLVKNVVRRPRKVQPSSVPATRGRRRRRA